MSTASAAQIAASRANGACSQGPVTPEGKARAAANSRKHGLASKEFILETEAKRLEFQGKRCTAPVVACAI